MSENHWKCRLLESDTVDEYFAAVIDFVNWLYSNCGDSTTGETIAEKISGRLQKRWTRINEIRDEIITG